MSAASADVCESGTLLADLERRQDDVLAQLDALDRQLTGLLKGLGVTLVDDAEASNFAAASEDEPGDDEASGNPTSPLSRGAGKSGQATQSPAGGFAKLPAEHGAAGIDQTRAA